MVGWDKRLLSDSVQWLTPWWSFYGHVEAAMLLRAHGVPSTGTSTDHRNHSGPHTPHRGSNLVYTRQKEIKLWHRFLNKLLTCQDKGWARVQALHPTDSQKPCVWKEGAKNWLHLTPRERIRYTIFLHLLPSECLSNWHKPESPGKRDSQWRKCSHQIGL